MSRQGIHPLLRGLDRPHRAATPNHACQLSGLESAPRKRYLLSESEESQQATEIFSRRSAQ